MAKLIYSTISSLDGYVADREGNFDWAVPDEEVHAFVDELERPLGTYLYGRRMYETMVAWETMDTAGEPAAVREFAEIWRAAEKVVYSRTLDKVASGRTRIELYFDPAAVRHRKMSETRDISVGGADLAGQALAAGLVDECWLLIAPVLVGGGRRALPEGTRIDLALLEERRFAGGMAYLSYRVRT
jgi:dihydrofolate reductase